MFDLIIIGGAAAGPAAAVYAARRRLKIKLISDRLGGEVALSGIVNNWPGIIEIQGYELANKFIEHAKSYPEVDLEEGTWVYKIVPEMNHHNVHVKKADGKEDVYQAKGVIIATGIKPRHLKVPGEQELLHKGLTYCTVCDGPLFRNKVTATIGSGNAALESALMMGELASKVYVLSKYPNQKEFNGGFPKGETILVDKIKANPKIEILYSVKTAEIIGPDKVTGLKYLDEQGKENTLNLDGVMIHIGQTPNSDIADCVEKDANGQIIVDQKCRTSCPGIFAAGDVTNIPYKQIGISAGQGITAALAAIEYINRWTEN